MTKTQLILGNELFNRIKKQEARREEYKGTFDTLSDMLTEAKNKEDNVLVYG